MKECSCDCKLDPTERDLLQAINRAGAEDPDLAFELSRDLYEYRRYYKSE